MQKPSYYGPFNKEGGLMSQEISGVSDALPLGNDTAFEETSHRKGHRIPGGPSTISTIQPHVDHRMNPNGGGIPFVSNKSTKSYWFTMFLLFTTSLIGGHDLYAGNIGKFIIKFTCFVPTLVTSFFFPPLFLALFLWPTFDFFTLCNGTYKDGYGKCI